MGVGATAGAVGLVGSHSGSPVGGIAAVGANNLIAIGALLGAAGAGMEIAGSYGNKKK